MYNPIILKEYGIYDILYNDSNEYIIITSNNMYSDIKLIIEENIIDFILYTTKAEYDANPIIYSCTYPVYYNNISLLINNIKIDVNVNNYPSVNNEIIISTMVRFEDPYILQFIKYYLSFGVHKFIIYDNSRSPINYYGNESSLICITDLPLILKDYIDNGIVILIDWPFLTEPGLKNRSQESQQNHSLYTFRKSKLIGYIDIDEYLNPQNEFTNLDNFFQNILNKHNLLLDNISGFVIVSKTFKNPYNLPENDFEFLKINTCLENVYEDISYHRSMAPFMWSMYQKCFIVPKNVKMMQVHYPLDTLIEPIRISKYDIYINHYMFLNKNRARDFNEPVVFDDTIKVFDIFSRLNISKQD